MKKGYKKEEGEAEINLKSPTFKKKFGGIYHIFKEESIKTSEGTFRLRNYSS